MCYSTMIEADMRKLSRRFEAMPDWDSFAEAFEMRSRYHSAMIPSAIDTYVIQNAETPLLRRLANMARSHYKTEIEKTLEKIKKYEQDVRDFEAKLKKGSKIKDLELKLTKRRATLERQKEKVENYRNIEEQGAPRVFPNYYAPVILKERGQRLIRLKRYHLCPKNGKELISYKYNLFNARKDRLLDSKIWKAVFGNQHGIFPFYRFYENVEGEDGKNKIIYFEPETKDLMWAASIYEVSQIKEGTLRSFAAITDDPPPEVAAAGHDRCPVYIHEDQFESWLEPKGKAEDLLSILNFVVETYFNHQAA